MFGSSLGLKRIRMSLAFEGCAFGCLTCGVSCWCSVSCWCYILYIILYIILLYITIIISYLILYSSSLLLPFSSLPFPSPSSSFISYSHSLPLSSSVLLTLLFLSHPLLSSFKVYVSAVGSTYLYSLQIFPIIFYPGNSDPACFIGVDG